ncbi:arabinosylfuranosidase ArfA [Xylanimonas ulmi]|uniref:non-reducing end alpha-L-arabinofuranosidase n=2 Tax=Xylanimonas ulmi TaxID=228973 RepID=A0A4Q7M445_9MICO|nr:alpha-N-arabinofuranosidase [Xylanibacterium ulmi]RZS62324.1 alpha-N-arabinofuranosidase [Xylanibacterium ulmi]
MRKSTMSVSPAFVVGPVRARTFGSFVEHLGRCVYTGIYEPEHRSADADGFRGDVMELVKELGVTTVRYPGGNFVSGYAWEDGIGPRAERPVRVDLAWHSTEPNWVGVDEFMRWCARVDVEPMMAVNLGTRGMTEAVNLLEYCNLPRGTDLSDRRRKNGAEEPYRVKLWCLGNEMDGPWQTGHKTPQEYARIATETARAMRRMYPDVELVACGSSNSSMKTFGAWEHAVLEEAYEHVDYISAHEYYFEENGDLASFLASAEKMDRFIRSVVATADAVRAAGKHEKRINVSFDEWNVWYQKATPSVPPSGDDFPIAPALLEDQYSVADAVVVGNLLVTLLKHTDRVHAASQAQLVNAIAPIMTEPANKGGRAWKQTIFHPFALTAEHAKGQVLQVAVESPTHETKQFGEVRTVDGVATHEPATGQVVVFVVNRSVGERVALDVDLTAFPSLAIAEALTMSSDDPYWKATAEDSHSVVPTPNESIALAAGHVTGELAAVSWTMIRLTPA